MPRLYFAYGSNLSREQMAQRCPGSQPICSARIEGYELTLRGVANIEKRMGATIHGALYELTPQDEKNLDGYEGYPTLYEKIEMEADTESGSRTVMFYQLVNPAYRSCREGYIGTIRQGLADWGLPATALEAAIEASTKRGDPLAL